VCGVSCADRVSDMSLLGRWNCMVKVSQRYALQAPVSHYPNSSSSPAEETRIVLVLPQEEVQQIPNITSGGITLGLPTVDSAVHVSKFAKS